MRIRVKSEIKEYHIKVTIDNLFFEVDNGSRPDPLGDLKPRIQSLFRAWYHTNLHVIEEFWNVSLELRKFGRRDKYSSQMIFHKMRLDSAISSDFDCYKINQNLGSALGRIIMEIDSELKGMFRTKN